MTNEETIGNTSSEATILLKLLTALDSKRGHFDNLADLGYDECEDIADYIQEGLFHILAALRISLNSPRLSEREALKRAKEVCLTRN